MSPFFLFVLNFIGVKLLCNVTRIIYNSSTHLSYTQVRISPSSCSLEIFLRLVLTLVPLRRLILSIYNMFSSYFLPYDFLLPPAFDICLHLPLITVLPHVDFPHKFTLPWSTEKRPSLSASTVTSVWNPVPQTECLRRTERSVGTPAQVFQSRDDGELDFQRWGTWKAWL